MDIDNVYLIKQTGNYSQAGPGYRETYRVDFHNGYLAAALIHNSRSDLPKYGDVPSWDTATFVTGVDVGMIHEDDNQQTGSALYNVVYSPIVAGYQLSPLDRPPDIEWGGEVQTEVMYSDLDGNAILNSAFDRYEPMPEREVLGAVVTITRNEADNPADAIQTYSMTTSSDDGDLSKMGIITAQKVYENGVAYWRVRYPIYIKNEDDNTSPDWRLRLIDNGHRKLVDDGDGGTAQRRIHDDAGNTSPVPCLLDGSGQPLAPGADPVTYPDGGYKRYESVTWTPLGLPDVFA